MGVGGDVKTIRIILEAVTGPYVAGIGAATGATVGLAKGLGTSGQALQQVGSKMSSFGSAMTKTITPAAAALAFAFKKSFDEWDQGADSLRISTGATGKALDRLTDSMKTVAGTVTQPLSEVGEVMGMIAQRTGLTGKPLEHLTTQVLRLAKITGEDAKTSVAAITRLFGDWSIATEDQSDTLDRLYRVSQASGIGFTRLSELMVQFGSPLRQLGLDFDFTAAMFARFEKEGVNIQTTMPGLRMALKNFAQAGREPAPALMETMEAIKATSSTAEANTMAFEVFGTRAGPDMAAAIREGRFDLTKLMDTMKNGKDTIDKTTDDITDLGDRFAMFRNKVMTIIGPVGEIGAVFFGAVAAIGPLVMGLGALTTAIGAAGGMTAVLATAMHALPFIAIGAAIIALAILVIRNWDTIKAATGDMIGWVIAGFAEFVEFFTNAAGRILDVAAGAFGWLPGVGDDVDAFRDRFKDATDGMVADLHKQADEFHGWGEESRGELKSTGNKTEEYGEKIQDTGQKVKKFAGMTSTELKAWKKSVSDSMDVALSALEKLRDDANVTEREWRRAFRSQTKAMEEYTDNLDKVQERDIPDKLLQQIVDMGMGGAGALEFLAGASKKEFNKYIDDTRDANKANKEFEEKLHEATDKSAGHWKKGTDKMKETTAGAFSDIARMQRLFVGDFGHGISQIRESIGMNPIKIDQGKPPKFASGGQVPGSGNQDSVRALLTPGEFVVRKKMVEKYGMSALQGLNKGLTPREVLVGGDGSESGVARYAQGGPVLTSKDLARGKTFAGAQAGKPYSSPENSVGPSSYDCSGFMSAITNVLANRYPYTRLFSTASFSPGVGGPGGMVPGLGQFSIGVVHGSPGHTAGTLDGLNVESTPPVVKVGSGARGALDSLFTMLFHLGSTSFTPGAGGMGNMIDPVKLVNDTFEDLKIPQFKGSLEGVDDRLYKDTGKELIKMVREASTFVGGGGGASWIREAMKITGAPDWWFSMLMQTMNAESGGNPNAVSSVPVASGQYATGLMQTIPSTFNANALPGYGDIFNPVHNAIASIRYRNARYSGGDWTPYGPISPYAKGGLVTADDGGMFKGPGMVGIGNLKEMVFKPAEKIASLSQISQGNNAQPVIIKAPIELVLEDGQRLRGFVQEAAFSGVKQTARSGRREF